MGREARLERVRGPQTRRLIIGVDIIVLEGWIGAIAVNGDMHYDLHVQDSSSLTLKCIINFVNPLKMLDLHHITI